MIVFRGEMTSKDSTHSPLQAYIFNTHPILIDEALCWDIYYITKDSTKINCVRVFDVELSFMIARLPLMKDNQFREWIKLKFPNERVEFRNDLKESEQFTFGENRLYAEIFSQNPQRLNTLLRKIKTDLKTIYARKAKEFEKENVEKFGNDAWKWREYAFYKNSETPIRFTATTTNLSKSVYNLSCKWDVPLIGGVDIDTSFFTSPPFDLTPNIEGAFDGLEFKDLPSCIKRNDNISFQDNIRLLSYDIETYTPDGPKVEPASKPEYEIFCIGVGLFSLNNQTPLESYCIISKDFDKLPTNAKSVKVFNRKAYDVVGEYGGDEKATYIIAKDEKDLLKCYIDILRALKPQLIVGFNSYGFDDKFVYRRCEMHKIHEEYLQCFTYYNLNELKEFGWSRPFLPTFQENIPLKIDGDMKYNNATVQAWSVLCVDVYKILLKEDPKRFTQQGYGNLNSMLAVYKVLNPYTKKQLSKTDMGIQEMFDNWIHGTKIYEIALYCRQDAWITGTLIVKRAKIGDLIELAGISFTSLRDSIFKADGMRVNNRIIAEAYSQGFALKDEASDERSEIIEQKPDIIPLGGKHFDARTIVGGAVRNLHPGLNYYVLALDYNSMYPSQKEANMCDSSSRVFDDMIKNPERYGLKIVKTIDIDDMYGKRNIYYIKKMISS